MSSLSFFLLLLLLDLDAEEDLREEDLREEDLRLRREDLAGAASPFLSLAYDALDKARRAPDAGKLFNLLV